MKKVRRILCGALAALLLAGCGSGAAGEYAIVETSYPARTQKMRERWTPRSWFASAARRRR